MLVGKDSVSAKEGSVFQDFIDICGILLRNSLRCFHPNIKMEIQLKSLSASIIKTDKAN